MYSLASFSFSDAPTPVLVSISIRCFLINSKTLFSADGKKHYDKNQATSQANACGNGELPLNVFCQNIGSQVQGDENVVAASGSQSTD
jgi:hypothetical protein